MLMLLLIATSVLGFSSSSSSSSSSSYLTPYAAASPISMNAATTTTTAATTTPITSTIKLGEEPFALGRYIPVSQTMTDKTLQQQLKLVFEGSTTITLPKQCLIERVKGKHFGPKQFLL